MITERIATPADLPIKISLLDEPSICEEYVKELKSVINSEQLRIFTDRWKAVFAMKTNIINEKFITPEEISIYEDNYDAKEAFQCIQKLRINACPHVSKEHNQLCVGAHIIVPYFLFIAITEAMKFQVPDNVAIVQLTGYKDAF